MLIEGNQFSSTGASSVLKGILRVLRLKADADSRGACVELAKRRVERAAAAIEAGVVHHALGRAVDGGLEWRGEVGMRVGL